MIRPMSLQDIPTLAKMHSQRAGISGYLAPMVESAYRAMLNSPLAAVFVWEEEAGRQITGFILSTTDRQRLLSDLISRMPGKVLTSLLTNPTGSKSLLKLLSSKVQQKGTTAEILFFECSETLAGQALLEQASAEMSNRGREALWLADSPAPELEPLLSSLGFNTVVQENGSSVFCQKLTPNPDYVPGPFSLRDRLRCAFRLELMVVFPIYTLVLIPFASFLAHLGCKLDAYFGLPTIIPEPFNYLLMAVLIISGGLLLVYSYSYLILEGEGGPVPPFSAKTRSLVTTGPYTYVRHPSILAKLVGVIGLGFGFNSWCFLLFIIPLLMCWSIFWNRSRQDADLVTVFGEEYLKYRREVPMLVPRFRRRNK